MQMCSMFPNFETFTFLLSACVYTMHATLEFQIFIVQKQLHQKAINTNCPYHILSLF
jgi:hypothetical protein